MRNLKRALSLTLASVMLLGMMVVGSSAAAGYDDVKETDNVEAIEVLQTVGVMVGDERGFGPDRPVNRAEMAVVMGLLLNLDYNYYSATCPFNDVYDWARGWVGACAANGIVSGRGDGVYDPGATVTAVEGASMLMRALGYFKYASDYADGFEVSTVRQGTTIGIFDGVGSSATEPMTRNQVAQMVLNTLKSGMVQPDGNTLNYFDNNGNIIATGGKINYVYVTSNKTFATAISSTPASSMGSFNDNPIVELGEQLYNGELKLYDKQTDEFGRPSRVWEYKGEEIGTYVKKEILKKEYTAKVTGQTLYELLGKSVVDEYQFRIFIDGIEDREANAATYLGSAYFTKADLYRTNKDAVGATGNGVLTQVYVDTDYRNTGNTQQKPYTVYINIINTYLAKSNEDYDTKNDDVQLRVWRLDNKNTAAAPIFVKSAVKNDVNVDKTNDYRDVYAKGEDFSLVKDVKKDDLYLVQVAQGEIQKIWAPEILDSVTVDAFKLFDHVTTGGQQYDHATTARYDVEAIENWTSLNGALNLKEMTYNVVLDQYGYLIGLERNEKANQYVFLTGLEAGASNLYAKQVDANVIHLDGTMETVKVDLTKSRCGQPGAEHKDHRLTYHNTGDNQKNLSQLNTWCTYTVNNNGVYTLTMVPVADTTNPTSTSVKIGQFAQNVDDYNDGPAEKDKEGNNTKSINTKRVSLNAADASLYVYGNDDTVYLTVSLDKVRVDDDYVTDYRWIVDDVEGVSTGVKNTNLIATELGPDAEGFTYPDAEIYTLYDNKGIVIAAVVIGDDEGASSTYAYVHTSGLEEESYKNTTATKAGDGEWTWLRKVIVNGEIVTLKEVGDNPKYLNDMAQGEWYEVKYNGDGNVRRTDKVTYVNNNVGADGDIAKWIAEVVDVEKSTAEYNTVLLRDITTVNGLTFKNGTLYTTREATKGFSIDPDVKVVLALAGKNGDKKGANWFDSTTDGYKGYTGLEQALREMNAEKSGEFTLASVQVSAVMENGRATSVIINDLNPAPETKPGGGKPSATGMLLTWNADIYTQVYVNNVRIDTNGSTTSTTDDATYVGGGVYTFPIKEKDKVEIRYAGISNTTGAEGVKTVDGVDYTVSATGTYVNFTVGTKSITVPAKADLAIGDGTTDPSGKLFVTYTTADWTGFTFAVNGSTVTPEGVNATTKRFEVKATDEVVAAHSSGVITSDGKFYVDTEKTVLGTADKTNHAISFTPGKSITLMKAADVLKNGINDTKYTVTYGTKTSNNTPATTATTKAVWLDEGATTVLKLDFTVPTGYEVKKAASSYATGDISVTAAVNGIAQGAVGFGSLTKNTDGSYSYVTDANAPVTTFKTAGEVALTVNFDLVKEGAGTASVSYKGAAMTSSGTATTLTKDTAAPAALAFKLDTSAIPTYAATGSKVRVTYTLSGTSADETTEFYEDVTIANPTVTGAGKNAAGKIYATADKVTVTVKSVEVIDLVKYTAVASKTHQVLASSISSANGTIGTAAALADFHVQGLKDGSGVDIVDGTKAVIKFTVSGIKGGDKQFTTKTITAADNVYKVVTGAMDGGMPQVEPAGGAPITITIDEVTIVSVRATYVALIASPGTANDEINTAEIGGQTLAKDDVGTPVDATVTGGKFEVTLTLTPTAGTGAVADGKYLVTGGYEGLFDVAAKSGATTITFEVTADDTATYNFLVTKVG